MLHFPIDFLLILIASPLEMNGSVAPAPFPELKIPSFLPNDGDLVGAAAYDQSFRGETNKLLSAHSDVMPQSQTVTMVKTICTIGTALMARTLIILGK